MSERRAHPLAELFPMLPEQEIRELADDIVTYGQRVPIVLLDNMVLDGRNRLAACRFADVEPEFTDYDGDDPLGFVLSHNLHRRHLSESQRAMIGAKIVDWERGMNQSTAGSADLQTRPVSAGEAARRLSISERAVMAAKRIRDHGAAELVAAITSGRVSVHAGEALSDLAHEAQLEVLRREEREIVARAKAIRAERQRARHTVRLAHMDIVAEKGRAAAPSGPLVYPLYYLDPPWQFGVRSEETGREKSAENHYPTLTTDALVDLLAPMIGPRGSDSHPAVCFLWATNPMLLDGLRVLAACGFAYVHHWIWDKEVAGTGYWGRDRHEILLIGRRGDIAAPLPGTQPETVFRVRKGAHSAKPDIFAETIEKLYPGIARIELFARARRPGWDAWGFESGAAEAASEAPVALSKDEKAGSAPEAPGTRQEAGREAAKTPSSSPAATPLPHDGEEESTGVAGIRPSVTADELDEWRLLGLIDGGMRVSGPAVDSLTERGLVWGGKALTVGGAQRLAELEPRIRAASDGDAVHVVDPPAATNVKTGRKRGFADALADWSELNGLKARSAGLNDAERARMDALAPVVAADLAPVDPPALAEQKSREARGKPPKTPRKRKAVAS